MIFSNSEMIRRYREEQDKTDEEKKRDKEWSLSECKKRGCLPTGEPIDSLYGQDY